MAKFAGWPGGARCPESKCRLSPHPPQHTTPTQHAQVAGVNFEEMLEAALGEQLDLSKPLVDYESGNDVITVWLE